MRVGIGGWTFEPWRGSFYPEGLPQKRELEYASRRLTSIEINATFYRLQKPASFQRWREEVPAEFVFSVKGPGYVTGKRDLADAGPAIERFFDSGIIELKEKLGPVNWQFGPGKQFDPGDFEAFLKLLPREVDGRAIRHAIEVRHKSFAVPGFIELLRAHEMALVFSDRKGAPNAFDVTAPFVYLRLQRCSEDEESGYAPQALDDWAKRVVIWAAGGEPGDLERIVEPEPEREGNSGSAAPREVFLYMINGFKPKAPSAAMALIDRLGRNVLP